MDSCFEIRVNNVELMKFSKVKNVKNVKKLKMIHLKFIHQIAPQSRCRRLFGEIVWKFNFFFYICFLIFFLSNVFRFSFKYCRHMKQHLRYYNYHPLFFIIAIIIITIVVILYHQHRQPPGHHLHHHPHGHRHCFKNFFGENH